MLEISHRTIEKIEKERYRLIAKVEDEEEAVQKFRDFVFDIIVAESGRESGVYKSR